jgi:formate dehydrogenase
MHIPSRTAGCSSSFLLGRSAFRVPRAGPQFLSSRLLTTQREKVKVLAVLYDGGKHAEQVRRSHCFPSLPYA